MIQTTAVIVGAGDAGLAMSRRLTERSIDHIVLERGEVANSWRTQRWPSLRLLTPNRHPGQLPDGGVLVVGASATGVQLAGEIHRSVRPVTLAVGEHVRLPRTYRGRDIFWWLEATGPPAERYEQIDDLTRYVNVLRDAMAVDTLDSCGVYFGTTGGQVYASADAGDSWAPIVRDLPAVLSVEVQTLP
jgi:cation diffusion facilitator CzcD-associated flavoprotein CzcO